MKQENSAASKVLDVLKALGPIMTFVLFFFMIIGAALPVLPLHVHDVLGFGPFVVGLVSGAQFVASLVSRLWAGRLADTRGSKFAVGLGLSAALIGGVFYILSILIMPHRLFAVGALLIGRTFLGGAESLIITGAMTWGLSLVPITQAGKVIAWVGMSMFAAMAIGAPLGSLVFEHWTFFGIAGATVVVSALSLLIIKPLAPVIPKSTRKTGMTSVLKAVLLPGIGFALSGITFGSETAFLTLFFAMNHWQHGAIAFSAFALALIVTRVVFGHFPDRFGGAKVSLYCLVIQATGLLLIANASSGTAAIVGAAVSGAGFSLVFPALGIEAVKRVSSENRGLAMGTYNAFLDLTLGFGSPALGFLASHTGLSAVFTTSAVTALLAMPIALILQMTAPKPAA